MRITHRLPNQRPKRRSKEIPHRTFLPHVETEKGAGHPGLVADGGEALVQHCKLHVGGDVADQAPILAQDVPSTGHQRIMRCAVLQRLQHLHVFGTGDVKETGGVVVV